MDESDDQPIDIRAMAKQRYENYLKQKRAHEELEKLGLTSEQLEERLNQQTQQENQKNYKISSTQGEYSGKQAGNQSEQARIQQRNQILTDLTMKITERFQKEMNIDSKTKKQNNNDIKLEQKISKEIENCTCPICYDLMVPPNNSPILLFPCGHTFCKACIIPKNQVKLTKCPFCRKQLQSYAVNITLQNIICAYTDNKDLLEKYKDQIDDINNSQYQNSKKNQKSDLQDSGNKIQGDEQTFEQNYKLFSLRCSILEQEKDEIVQIIEKSKDTIQTHTSVIQSLKKQKQSVQEKLTKLQQELKLIDNFINENTKAVQDQEDLLNSESEKLELLNQTLVPLQSEKQKYLILSQNQNINSKR